MVLFFLSNHCFRVEANVRGRLAFCAMACKCRMLFGILIQNRSVLFRPPVLAYKIPAGCWWSRWRSDRSNWSKPASALHSLGSIKPVGTTFRLFLARLLFFSLTHKHIRPAIDQASIHFRLFITFFNSSLYLFRSLRWGEMKFNFSLVSYLSSVSPSVQKRLWLSSDGYHHH